MTLYTVQQCHQFSCTSSSTSWNMEHLMIKHWLTVLVFCNPTPLELRAPTNSPGPVIKGCHSQLYQQHIILCLQLIISNSLKKSIEWYLLWCLDKPKPSSDKSHFHLIIYPLWSQSVGWSTYMLNVFFGRVNVGMHWMDWSNLAVQ